MFKRFRWTFVLTVLALVVGAMMAGQGAVPRSVEIFGYVFLVARLVIYLGLFVFFFDELTVPILTAVTKNPDYAIEHAKPYRYRCLFWIVLVEFFLVVSWF